jgi:hypothetical protein
MGFPGRKRYLLPLLLLAATVAAAQKPVAPTPPMGWNSWDAYGLTITEPQFRANVRVLKAKLAPFGWNYAVIDEGWFFENPQDRDTPDKLHYAIDPFGRYVPVPARFPSAGKGKPSTTQLPPNAKLAATIEETSFAALGKYVHAQGLKFGIHIVRGIPRASVERDLPIQGSSFRATDAADTADVCPWDPTNWGIKDNAAGQAWYDSLLRQYAGWGVDILKVDCIGDHPYKVSEIRMIRRAIDKTGRPIVLSLSPGPMNLSHADEVVTLANMWRISDDEWDLWKADSHFPQGIFDQFPRLAAWQKYAKPGTWPDADMLAIGELRPNPGWGKARTSRLTPDEQRTLLTAWSMAHSPLILGANLTLLDDATLKLLTNRDLIAVDQVSTKNDLSAPGNTPVWSAELPNGQIALAFFNLTDKPTITDYNDGYFTPMSDKPGHLVRDAWTGQELGNKTSLSVTLPPHGTALYILH